MPCRFNEGRHAHAAEYDERLDVAVGQRASMRGGMRMPPNFGGHGAASARSTLQ